MRQWTGLKRNLNCSRCKIQLESDRLLTRSRIWQSPMWSFFQEALGREADGYGWSMRPLGASQTSWRQQNFESD
jgi:hypothetical protein